MKNILEEYCIAIYDCEHKTAPLSEFGYPSIRTPNIGKGRLILEGVNLVSENTWKEWTKRAIPEYQDLIFAREAPAGNIAIVPKNIKLCLGQRTVLIKPNKHKIVPEFLCYYLLSPLMQNELFSKSAGSTVAHINVKDIKNLHLFNLPTLPIQQKIASILSAYDDLIEINLKRIKLLEETAQRTYKELLINEILEEKEIMFFGEVITGKTPSTLNQEFFDGNTLFVKTPDMHDAPYVIESTQKLSEKGANSQKGKFIPKNSLMVSCIGSAGVCALASQNCQTNQQINSIRFYKSHYSYYLYCFSKELKPLLEALGSNGATMTNVNKGKFEQIKVPYFGEDIQVQFHNQVKNYFELILNLQTENRLLKEARDILLPGLMTGVISV